MEVKNPRWNVFRVLRVPGVFAMRVSFVGLLGGIRSIIGKMGGRAPWDGSPLIINP